MKADSLCHNEDLQEILISSVQKEFSSHPRPFRNGDPLLSKADLSSSSSSLPLSLSILLSVLLSVLTLFPLFCMYVLPWQSHVNNHRFWWRGKETPQTWEKMHNTTWVDWMCPLTRSASVNRVWLQGGWMQVGAVCRLWQASCSRVFVLFLVRMCVFK